ncbi:hypothetical protein [Actinophytocola xanthii]|uniref:Uncharacterized protein n=1 Tax=Actinophytocola xanthii TaxID=1912961 RepID=A0A1Q8CJY1_9PSEU|nr:hypothetical protein [Actinophytocola xanthii]OLF14670.1 hypothetical protein BU204_25915 [Actinophytocola xanthii]
MSYPDPRAALAAILQNSNAGRNAMRAVGRNNGGGGNASGVVASHVGPRPVTQTRILEECGQTLIALWEQSRAHAVLLPSPATRGLVLPGGNPQTPKNEQGCWIFHNTVSDTFRVETWTGGSTRDSCTPTAPAPQANEVLVVDFHTHPNVGQEGYLDTPSPADIAAVGTAVTGLVRSHGGYHWFGKAMPA